MSFFYKPYDLIKKNKRSLRTQCKAQAKCNIYVEKSLCRKRAFCCISFPGSMTVEAACIVPLFVFAIVCLMSLFYMLGTSYQMYYMMAQTAHHAGIYGYDENMDTSTVIALMAGQMMNGDTDYSSISGGMAGINLFGSSYDSDSGEIVLSARYKMKTIIDMFGITLRGKNQIKTRAYIGGKMLCEETALSDKDYMTVYVAENGVVYHKNRECAYIDITLTAASTGDVEMQRNSQGGKYYPCEICAGKGDSEIAYITDTGNRYHTDAGCSGIRRTVYEMQIGADCPLPACSRCGG